MQQNINVGQAMPDNVSTETSHRCQKTACALLQRINNKIGMMALSGHCQAKPDLHKWRYDGFTLIELLVVVLIIGILAAVALPQYQKAVWKSRNAQLKTLVSTVGKAQQAYRMANGKNTYDFDELDIDLPLTSSTGGECAMSNYTNSGRKGNNFEIQLYTGALPVLVWWTSGPYRCAGFAYNQNGEMFCVERNTHFTGQAGSFCNQIEKATASNEITQKYIGSYASKFYILP